MAIETVRARKERLKREKKGEERKHIFFSVADMHIQTGTVYHSIGEYTFT